MNRLLALLYLVITTACRDSTPLEDAMQRAMRLQAAGQPGAALDALRDAIDT